MKLTNAEKNRTFLSNASTPTKEKALYNVAKHYGITFGQALEEVCQDEAELLPEYMTGIERLEIYQSMKKYKLA